MWKWRWMEGLLTLDSESVNGKHMYYATMILTLNNSHFDETWTIIWWSQRHPASRKMKTFAEIFSIYLYFASFVIVILFKRNERDV